MPQPFVLSTLFVLGLLLVGFALRAGVKPLRTLFVPASVVGGTVGLLVMQAMLRLGDEQVEAVASEIGGVISGWPGLLIAVVFAGLLMERPGKKFKDAMLAAGRQGIVVWIIVFGEAFVGLLACWLLIEPFYDVPDAFGQLIETGFAGGHGTAAAMGEVYDKVFAFPQGRDLAFLFATAGLVYGVVSGIFFVNLGVRRGWLRGGPHAPDERRRGFEVVGAEVGASAPAPTDITIPVVSGLENRVDSPPSAFAKVRSEVIDPLAFQLCLLAVAFGVGFGMQQLFLFLADALAPAEWQKFIGNVPLFLFTLLGGWVTRELMHLLGVGDLIDGPSIQRLGGIAMELLIVAALATLRIDAARDYLVPVIILLVVGFAWVAFCLLVVGRHLLPRSHWFELGLLNYGMSTATTAQGVLLLRIVDRDLDTDAANDYAAAAPLSAPFIGGGVLTVLAIPLALQQLGYAPVLATMAIVLVGLFALGWSLRDRA